MLIAIFVLLILIFAAICIFGWHIFDTLVDIFGVLVDIINIMWERKLKEYKEKRYCAII